MRYNLSQTPRSGFSLVELLVTMAILSALMAVIVATLNATFNIERQTRGVAEEQWQRADFSQTLRADTWQATSSVWDPENRTLRLETTGLETTVYEFAEDSIERRTATNQPKKYRLPTPYSLEVKAGSNAGDYLRLTLSSRSSTIEVVARLGRDTLLLQD